MSELKRRNLFEIRIKLCSTKNYFLAIQPKIKGKKKHFLRKIFSLKLTAETETEKESKAIMF